MYGDNGALLRAGLTQLLRQHRIQQRVTGRHWRTAPDIAAEASRLEASQLIRTYRQAVLVWCHQTAAAINPYVVSNLTHLPSNPFVGAARELAPLDSLERALKETRDESSASLPTLELLTTRHELPLVESWRQIARAAALAEHDINVAPGTRALTVEEALTVAGDVAAISQALVVLDQRYKKLPEWEPLRKSLQLGWASLACALDAGLGSPDLAVDDHRWRPRTKPMRGPVRPGYLGVLQAEHNLVVKLGRMPKAINLRLIVDSQRLLSSPLAERVETTDRRAADRWRERAQTYRLLQRQLRDIGGLVGGGGAAAGHTAAAVTRLRSITMTARLEPAVIRGFASIFARVDERVADIVEASIAAGQYFERTKLPIVASDATRLVHMAKETFVPVSAATQTRLRAIARHRLRPAATSASAGKPDGLRNRAEIQAALVHRPSSGQSPRMEI